MKSRLLLYTIGISLVAIGSSCKKKVAMATPPPPPAAVRESTPPAPEPQRQRPANVAVAPTPEAPAPAVVSKNTPKSLEDLLNKLLDAYFDYDKATLRTDAQTALNANSTALRELLQEFPNTRFVVEGNCNKDIANRLDLSLHTVETHRWRIMEKMGLHGVADLVLSAVRRGLVT